MGYISVRNFLLYLQHKCIKIEVRGETLTAVGHIKYCSDTRPKSIGKSKKILSQTTRSLGRDKNPIHSQYRGEMISIKP